MLGVWDHEAMVDRRMLRMRDMVGAVGVLAVVLLILLFAMGFISFGNSANDGETPTADVTGGLERARASLELPIAIPTGLPSTWHPNSFFQRELQTPEGSFAVVRAGWLTPSGSFVTLVQSTAAPAELVASELGKGLVSDGTARAGDAEWTVYPGRREEVAWVRRGPSADGPVTLLITGSADISDFEVLAAGVAAGSS
jgi:hypothetical protein